MSLLIALCLLLCAIVQSNELNGNSNVFGRGNSNDPTVDVKATVPVDTLDRDTLASNVSPNDPLKSVKALYGEDLSQVDKNIVFEGLRRLYTNKVLPLEIASKYANFASAPLGPSDFDAKPMVLVLGQYSVGKSSFIRSLLKQDFPGLRIGPEPTTDRFTAIMHTTEGQVNGRLIPGHALVMQTDKPFRGLASYGNNFLSKFEGAEVAAPILQDITLVDTPGVLAGEKQRIGRDYDFSEVVRWFAERADMIIVMFDAHKLDISDELKTVLDALKFHQDKIRVLLNKADTIDAQSLLRVYGALMWSLGKVVQTPEVCRVYLGSFWDEPLKLEENKSLLEAEKQDLISEMQSLSQNAVVRRINELVKRARSVKVHAYIIHYLRKQMPYMGVVSTSMRDAKQRELIDHLEEEFRGCARRYNLPLGDFPDVEQYRKMLREVKDLRSFRYLDKSLVHEMDKVLTEDIPKLLQQATRASQQQQQQQQQQYASGSEFGETKQPPRFHMPPPPPPPPSAQQQQQYPPYGYEQQQQQQQQPPFYLPPNANMGPPSHPSEFYPQYPPQYDPTNSGGGNGNNGNNGYFPPQQMQQQCDSRTCSAGQNCRPGFRLHDHRCNGIGLECQRDSCTASAQSSSTDMFEQR